MTGADDITNQLNAAHAGGRAALDSLLPLVYDELRALANRARRRERADHTLTTTALVHEAYIRMVAQDRATWQNRAHFYALAATAMRRILVDYARRRQRLKRGGAQPPVTLHDDLALSDERADALLELDEALDRLAQLNGRLAHVVECRFFGGMTTEEIAAALGVTTRTVERDWQKARGWLFDQLRESPL